MFILVDSNPQVQCDSLQASRSAFEALQVRSWLIQKLRGDPLKHSVFGVGLPPKIVFFVNNIDQCSHKETNGICDCAMSGTFTFIKQHDPFRIPILVLCCFFLSTSHAMLMCHKQRNGEAEEWYNLWYNKESQQFIDAYDSVPMAFDDKGEF